MTIGWITATIASLKAGQSALTGTAKDGKSKPSPLNTIAKFGPPIFLVGFLLFISTAEHMFLSYPKLKQAGLPLGFSTLADHHFQWLDPEHMWRSPGDWPLAAPG